MEKTRNNDLELSQLRRLRQFEEGTVSSTNCSLLDVVTSMLYEFCHGFGGPVASEEASSNVHITSKSGT